MVYVSTSCLKNPTNVIKVLQEYEKANIENVELGSVHTFFNVKKLKISTTSFNDWEIISEISYDGEIIDSVSEENEPTGEEFKILMI